MDDKKIIQNIMILVKKKYNNVEQILNYTNDIYESMAQDDFDTVNMLLDMRASLMDETDRFNEEISKIIALLPDETRIRVSCQLSDSEINSEMSFEESKIKEFYLLTKTMLSKIIELDRTLESQISARNKLLAMENA